MLSKYKTDRSVNLLDELKVEIIPTQYACIGQTLLWYFWFTIVIVLCFRSVASWFDEDGTLLFDILEKDVRELHNGIASEKKDK